MIVLGIHDGRDSGIALIDGGEVVYAANEERYTREKLHFGFPFLALQHMFRHTGIKPKDIHAVTTGFEAMVENSKVTYNYTQEPRLHHKIYTMLAKGMGQFLNGKFVAKSSLQFLKILSQNKKELKQNIRNFGIEVPIHFMNHHLSHAASAYYTCGKETAIIVSSDGGGDGISGGIFLGQDKKLKDYTIFSKLNSAGIFWEMITQICGFNPERHGGKITGLAAYSKGGDAYFVLSKFFGYCLKSGGMENKKHFAFQNAYNFIYKHLKRFDREELAAGAQRLLDEVFVQTVKDAIDRHKISDIALAGGTFANVLTNYKIRQISDVNSIHIFPHFGDGGIAVGSALLYCAQNKPFPIKEIEHLFWGDEWAEPQIRLELEATRGISYKKVNDPGYHIAEAIANKQVVGVFHGRMEYGPRALGHRSILAEPTDPTMMDWLNKRLARTEFMPFAPIILEEDAYKYFENFKDSEYPSKFMTICMQCTPLCKEKAPGVVHLDGTARPQAVSFRSDPYIYNALIHYRERTGLPLFINTSFNKHEEPIVGSPIDALSELKRGAVDVLFLESFMVKLEGPEV